jgi:hypothetical protein
VEQREREREREAIKPEVSKVIRSRCKCEGETDVSSLPLHFTQNKIIHLFTITIMQQVATLFLS